MSKQRLDKYLSHIGAVSRRQSKHFLKEQAVMVNGQQITDPSFKIDPDMDAIAINEQEVKEQKFVYFMLNKPAGVISTVSDEKGRENVIDYIDTPRSIFPIGRLDKDTTGLILLTDDGELTHKLIHPKFHVPKVYELTIQGEILSQHIALFEKGVPLKDGITRPAQVHILKKTGEQTLMQVTLHEGRYRQIRRMCGSTGLELVALHRVEFGSLHLGKLKKGESRPLTEKEITSLRDLALK